jgi:hypothetical protein
MNLETLFLIIGVYFVIKIALTLLSVVAQIILAICSSPNVTSSKVQALLDEHLNKTP